MTKLAALGPAEGATHWTIAGLKLGSSLADVIKANGGKFEISGFEWDYGGYITNLKGGKLSSLEGGCMVTIRFNPPEGKEVPSALSGEKSIASSDAKLAKLNPRVSDIQLGWAGEDGGNGSAIEARTPRFPPKSTSPCYNKDSVPIRLETFLRIFKTAHSSGSNGHKPDQETSRRKHPLSAVTENATPSQASNASASMAKAATGPAMAILIMISVSHMLNDLMQSVVPSVYPILKDKFQLSYADVGLLTFTWQLTASILQPGVGFYTDKHPKPFSSPSAWAARWSAFS